MNGERQFGADGRGVSPVIGIVLMVAVTAVLAGVFGAFAADIGQSSANPAATILIDENADEEVTVAVRSAERLDSLEVDEGDCDNSDSIDPEVGETLTIECEDLDEGDETTIRAIGTHDGIESVITSYEYQGR